MKKTNTVLSATAVLALLLGAQIARPQGSLTPTNPPSPTMKTLEQMEPRTALPAGPGLGSMIITQPGSYYFTGDRELTGTAFFIRTNGVTIDLNGYTLRNPGTANIGILVDGSASTPYHGVTIRNGTISGFNYGVRLTAASGCRVENVTVVGAGSIGFYVEAGGTNADGNIFLNCAALQSGSTAGFYLSGHNGNCRGNLLVNCTASGGPGGGFQMFGSSSSGNVSGNLLQGCTASGNSSDGFRLTASSAGCRGNRLIQCTATLNDGDGFELTSSSLGQLHGNVIEDSQSVSNSATGILVNGNGGALGNKLSRNLALRNGQNGISTTGSDAGLTIGNLSVNNGANNYLLDATDINGPIVTTSGTLGTTGADAHPHANYSR